MWFPEGLENTPKDTVIGRKFKFRNQDSFLEYFFLRFGDLKNTSHFLKKKNFKIRSFYEDSCAIIISFKSVVIFADFVLISAKMTTFLK